VASDSLSLLQGTLGVLLLKTLAGGPQHGYAITRFIHQKTDGMLEIEDAALYQALHRLEHRGLVEAEWGLSQNNRKAKYYRLTTAGRKELRAETSLWRRYAAAVTKVLESA
jgi:PadR family transcriptional regulator PadR